MPRWNSISVSGYHIREAGATAVQEVAFTLGNGIAYVEAAVRAGLPVDGFAPQLAFFFNAHNTLLEEVAKFRAARRLWATIMRDRFGAKDPRSMMLRFHTQTGGVTLTAQQPENNIVRAAIQALASVLGGVQSLALSCYDEALAIPTEEAQRIALRTQQILAHETGVTDTADPLGGSYFVEKLTNEIEVRAQELLDRVEDMGGSVAAIESGYMQQEIQEAAVKQQREVESGRRVVVGVNRFRTEEGQPQTIFRVNTEAGRAQIERVQKLRSSRDNDRAAASLRLLNEAARGDDNLMPSILEAVKSYATLGEICGELRTVFGEYRAPTVV
jgi:methylmalonyl-CoA mutase N-terminal domain/subunit